MKYLIAIITGLSFVSCANAAYYMDTGLTMYQRFDTKDRISGRPLDVSGNFCNGTMENIASSTFYKSGRIGQSFNFDGVNDAVSITPVATCATGSSGTVSAWINSSLANSQQAIVTSSSQSDTTHEWRFSINNTGCGFNCVTIVENNGGTANVVRGSTKIETNRWYHVVITSNGTSYKFYVNGRPETVTVQIGSNTGNWFSDITTRVNMKIGLLTRTSSVIPFFGKIDDVRVYNGTELSALQVYQLFRYGLSQHSNY